MGRQCFFYIPLMFLLNGLYGFNGFVFVQPGADLMTSVIAIALGITLMRKLNEESAV
jgi:hypothetical protein